MARPDPWDWDDADELPDGYVLTDYGRSVLADPIDYDDDLGWVTA